VDANLRALLSDLYAFGERNDATPGIERAARMLNITPATGELLRMLVVGGGMRRVLELGTSNGYSTIWLADGCRAIGGRVVTYEASPAKHGQARENLRKAGLEDWVDARLGEIGAALPGLRDFDLVFLDTERSSYVGWWPELRRAVRVGGLLVVDNATSHEAEMRPFVEVLAQERDYTGVLVPVGNGELFALRER
jgi:predicted O-methyltransferase YrrM